METTLDIFRNDAFSYTSLQRVTDNAPFVPQALAEMGVFEPEPIDTVEVLIYEKDGGFAIIPTKERGGPDVQQLRRQGRLFGLKAVALGKRDTLYADELQGFANMALPEGVRLRNAAQEVANRTAQLKTDMEATKERHRLAALQGKLLDADDRVIFDYFDVFGVQQAPEIDTDFASADLGEDEALMYFQENIFVPIRTVLENRWMPTTRVGALVGDDYWGKLMRNKAFRELYKLMLQGRAIAREANPLAVPNNWETVYFGGIYWTNYRGSTGGEIAIATDEAKFFPIGAKDVFNVYWAPGETLQDVNQNGRPEYLYVQPDVRTNIADHVDIILRSYPLYACIFPKALLRSKLS